MVENTGYDQIKAQLKLKWWKKQWEIQFSILRPNSGSNGGKAQAHFKFLKYIYNAKDLSKRNSNQFDMIDIGNTPPGLHTK